MRKFYAVIRRKRGTHAVICAKLRINLHLLVEKNNRGSGKLQL